MSRLAGRRPSISSIPFQSASSNYTAVGEPPHRTDTCNIVIFGEAGAGKSSLVNLIAGEPVAMTSFDAGGCTTATNAHEVLIQNGMLKVKFFDTAGRSSSLLFVAMAKLDAGLGEGSAGIIPDNKVRKMLRKLLRTLTEQGDLHLIMYCVRGERVMRTLRRNYELIHSNIKRKVPIVLVVTCLESYQPDMEEWWRLKERAISNLGITFAGHACITTATSHEERRAQSYDAVCKLIEQCRVPSRMAASRKQHTNIVIFGGSGTGKSSLVNLMAGAEIAAVSCAMDNCTVRWEEYSIKFGGESYKVFDTVGLEEPQLGIPQYLDAIENAYSLIQHLDRQGGVDLLLFCMRAGRLTDTLQSNYRLFYEFLCNKKVPIVVVITHLENENGEMDTWWKENEQVFRQLGIRVAGHACITATKGFRGIYKDRYEESRTTIRKLVKECTVDGQKQVWNGVNTRFVLFIRKLRGRLVGSGNLGARKDVVPRLIKRCGMSPDVAKQLADMIKNGVVEGAT
ncbi:P-loop containing nucleoside triphosphate hydrolase protein [Suillus placidus]|uniref:P-loop containing nucleoside triphosphate hydrolase protein n=1 Tax=Suillus placidus TaxID=48579 RepID=A0A9P6ZZ65_9AGAM|nr:P-loop containing nucleoside triphosphate hydrolase protein [Suillus placidus]